MANDTEALVLVLRALADRVESGELRVVSAVGAIGVKKYDLGKIGTELFEQWTPSAANYLTIAMRRVQRGVGEG
jgi:hypothetical protein